MYREGECRHVSGTGDPGPTAGIDGLSAFSTDSQVAATVGIRQRF
ncbi:MAG: hypothetical protein ACRYGL_08185 [Janthinobacterium lividum]